MTKKAHKLRGMKVNKDNMRLEMGTEHLNNRLNFAQYALDSAVMTSMEPLMPKDTGQFINVTKLMSASIAGTGKVVAAAPPFGRFLYEGKVMVGVNSRSAWAKKGEKKVVTKNNLQYSRGGPKWFDKAKEKDREVWQSVIDKAMKSK